MPEALALAPGQILIVAESSSPYTERSIEIGEGVYAIIVDPKRMQIAQNSVGCAMQSPPVFLGQLIASYLEAVEAMYPVDPKAMDYFPRKLKVSRDGPKAG